MLEEHQQDRGLKGQQVHQERRVILDNQVQEDLRVSQVIQELRVQEDHKVLQVQEGHKVLQERRVLQGQHKVHKVPRVLQVHKVLKERQEDQVEEELKVLKERQVLRVLRVIYKVSTTPTQNTIFVHLVFVVQLISIKQLPFVILEALSIKLIQTVRFLTVITMDN